MNPQKLTALAILCLSLSAFWACEKATRQSSKTKNRELAIAKNNEAVQMVFDLRRHSNLHGDSLALVLSLLDESIQADSSYLLPYSLKIRLLNEQNQLTDAMLSIDDAMRHSTNNPDLYLVRGLQYEKMQAPDKAQTDYRQALLLSEKQMLADTTKYYPRFVYAFASYLLHGQQAGLDALAPLKLLDLTAQETAQLDSYIKIIATSKISANFSHSCNLIISKLYFAKNRKISQ
ncbi:MAG: hypothetical protein LBR66_04320 [Candidatus Symbiothrix sp.]|jgi:tetratricopeptide (TPR) repeat protein|nr:hypothetical protein [Candidatus Symbiothrix sp.]